jgi:hypothetical protein
VAMINVRHRGEGIGANSRAFIPYCQILSLYISHDRGVGAGENRGSQ